MKNQAKPENMIGAVKIVGGFTFTLVDKEQRTFLVEITKEGTDFSELKTVAHNTWRLGVFKKILNEINPQPKEKKIKERKPPRQAKPKVINHVIFRIIEKNKETRRVKVIADGFTGVYEMSESTWYRGKFYKNIMKVLKQLALVLSSTILRTRGDRSTPVKAAINDMANIDTVEELKKYWRTECKKFHPDHGGNVEDFKEVRFWYEDALQSIQLMMEVFAEHGYNF